MKEGEEEEDQEEYGAHLYCEVLRALAAIWLVRLGCLPRGVDTCWGTNGTFAEYHNNQMKMVTMGAGFGEVRE